MTENQDYTIAKLNTLVKLRLAPSKIHGVGVFAMRESPKGTKLYADNMPEVYHVPYSNFNKLFPDVAELLLERWPQIVNGSNFIYPDARMIAYMNHGGDESNYDAETDTLLLTVDKGEEITEDYRKILNYQKVYTWLK